MINATSLATLLSDLQAALQATNSGAVVETPTGSAAGILSANGDNVEILFPSATTPDVTPESFSYDLSGYATNGAGVAITQITVLPEPAALSLLTLGGIGFLKRRRRCLFPSQPQ